MKTFLLAGLMMGVVVSLQAQTAAPATPPAAAAPNPAADAAWTKIDADKQELIAAEKIRDMNAIKTAVTKLRPDVDGFAAKYPTDGHAAEASMLSAQAGYFANRLQLAGAPTLDQVTAQFQTLATNPALPVDARVGAAGWLFNRKLVGLTLHNVDQKLTAALGNPPKKDPAAAAKNEDALYDEFAAKSGTGPGQYPPEFEVVLRQEQIRQYEQGGDPARAQQLLAKLAASPRPEIADLAKRAQAEETSAADLKSKPMDLAFTALDGSAIDLAKLRGKVVLVDFWATWCPPCRGETPDVVAAYQKYHDKGFEILGVSLDQDKGALQQYITANKMTWPQYFDGKGWDNAISSRFGIQSIPAMWLVGKDGKLVTQDGRDDLDGQVGKLLAAP